MHSRITTTITTTIDLDTFQLDHSVTIDAEDALPRQVILAAVEGACKATINSLGGTVEYTKAEEVDDA